MCHCQIPGRAECRHSFRGVLKAARLDTVVGLRSSMLDW